MVEFNKRVLIVSENDELHDRLKSILCTKEAEIIFELMFTKVSSQNYSSVPAAACVIVDTLSLENNLLETVKKIYEINPSLLFCFIIELSFRNFDEINGYFEKLGKDNFDFIKVNFNRYETLQKIRNLVYTWNKRKREDYYLNQLLLKEKLTIAGKLAVGISNELSPLLTIVRDFEPVIRKKFDKLFSFITYYESNLEAVSEKDNEIEQELKTIEGDVSNKLTQILELSTDMTEMVKNLISITKIEKSLFGEIYPAEVIEQMIHLKDFETKKKFSFKRTFEVQNSVITNINLFKQTLIGIFNFIYSKYEATENNFFEIHLENGKDDFTVSFIIPFIQVKETGEYMKSLDYYLHFLKTFKTDYFVNLSFADKIADKMGGSFVTENFGEEKLKLIFNVPCKQVN